MPNNVPSLPDHEFRILALETQVTKLADALKIQLTPQVVVTAYKEIVIDADNSDCEYTYSDGTTYRFHWKTTNSKGSYITDGNGNNGRWTKTLLYQGDCSDKVIGKPKI